MNDGIYLASASPRRRQLLEQIGVRYELVGTDVVERIGADETPEMFALRMALEKARAGASGAPAARPVLGADTVVAVDGAALGKPADRDHALQMLEQLSGQTHHVYTGVAVVDGEQEATRLSVSAVTFRELDRGELEAYWHSGEPVGKAGAYAIQGLGAVFVERLDGSYSGVMGLPLFETAELLRGVGIDPLGGAVERGGE